MPSFLVLLALSLGLSPQPNAPQPDAAAKALQQAFLSGDATAMKAHFADKIVFIGDPRFLGEDGRQQVQRDLSRDQLTDAYTKLFDAMGRDKWRELTKQAKPSLTRAAKDGTHAEDTTGLLPPAFIKTGEYMLELRFPGSGLDDVILFVLRDVGGKWQVVAHWADY
jgi:hypothetical protein